MSNNEQTSIDTWRNRLYVVIFESNTPTGKSFDVLLIVSIIMSVIAVMLDSVSAIHNRYGDALYVIEWFFTLLFTVEYILRLVSTAKPVRYARSFFGLVDLLAVAPTYVSMFVPGSQYLITLRILRILRVFRVLKLVEYSIEAQMLLRALHSSRRKITVFVFVVLTLVVIFGSLMYLIEGEPNGFTSIPRSVYWAIVTMTTVGYGDISPKTNIGQILAAIIMIMGYGIIAVPTGIVSVELAHARARELLLRHVVCPQCSSKEHMPDAKFCKDCGAGLTD